MLAWIDIDNPPQVQYMAPFVGTFQRRGLDVLVTARDYGFTTELLKSRGIAHNSVGGEFGASRFGKVRGTIGRAIVLATGVARRARPSLLLSTSRSAAMAARILRTPSFMILDYEHAELSSFRVAGTTVLYPDVIDSSVLRAKGFRPERLEAFAGIKEDISFDGRDLGATEPHDFGVNSDGLALVLVRPPSETSHYASDASRDLAADVLASLAVEPSLRVVYSPRHPQQIDALRAHQWVNEPIVLERPVEFVSLLKAVDWVVCSGGTMLREAAYLGVPAISIFRSEVGAVDRMLERLGAVRLVDRPEDLVGIDWRAADHSQRIPQHPGTVDHLTDRMLERVRP